MAGVITPLFSKRRFDFGGLGASQTMEVVLLKAVDVSRFREGLVLLRVHAATITHASSLMDLELRGTLPSAEDPARDFLELANLASIRVSSSTSAPVLLTASLGSDFGALVQVGLKVTRGASGSVSADLSADLVLKE